MYETYDEAIEGYNPWCFKRCPEVGNKTSTCYLGCYSEVVKLATTEQLVEPWGAAFEKCPEVQIPTREYLKYFLQ